MITVNEYFDGHVKSLGYQTASGQSTIGVMNNGEYEFGTSSHETMIIIEGRLHVLLPEAKDWATFEQGQSFEVPANERFKVRSEGQTSYLCRYK
jgi:uncharacterized protein YaiE (UPF0345 family)